MSDLFYVCDVFLNSSFSCTQCFFIIYFKYFLVFVFIGKLLQLISIYLWVKMFSCFILWFFFLLYYWPVLSVFLYIAHLYCKMLSFGKPYWGREKTTMYLFLCSYCFIYFGAINNFLMKTPKNLCFSNFLIHFKYSQ